MLVPFARLLAGLASHPRGRTRFTAIFCGLLGGKSHQRQLRERVAYFAVQAYMFTHYN